MTQRRRNGVTMMLFAAGQRHPSLARPVTNCQWRQLLVGDSQRCLVTDNEYAHHHHSAGLRARTALAREFMRTHGYRLAAVNPLRRDGFMNSSVQQGLPLTLQPLLSPLLESRLGNQPRDISLPPPLSGTEEEQVLKSLLEQYCGGIGYEFMHCATNEEREFFIHAAESSVDEDDEDTMLWCLEQVQRAGAWERLLGKRYPTCRRFSLEGLESSIVALNTILDTFAADTGYKKRVVLGTLHRGRVNMLHTVLQRSVSSLLAEWDDTDGPTYDDINFGHSRNVVTRKGSVHVSLVSMPAHLESQDASVAGKARGHMVKMAMESKDIPIITRSIQQSVLPLVVHGDASFGGQGIVSETLQLSTFQDFDSGGTIHVILNNQIGFTCETQKMRSERHRLVNISDLALSIRAPVLHVNAEKPAEVMRAARLATEYRQQFGKDIVLDMWGFRRHGHNEVDEPRITNALLYEEVDRHDPVADVFAFSLTEEWHDCGQELQDRIEAEYAAIAPRRQQTDEEQQCGAASEESNEGEWLYFKVHPTVSDRITGVEMDDIRKALSTISHIRDGFTLHPLAARVISRRREMCDKVCTGKIDDILIDWATAELLALCILAEEGHYCRLSGQDSRRGTFGQRHAVLHDTRTGQLHHILPSLVDVVDSPLSELGVLGFEHGFSLASPNFLVMWEAQFADFVDNSQALIDTMIASEKEKFGLESNLVLLLPHGYDGMGPEHSSSRLERFLTLHTDTVEVAEQSKDDLERFRSANFTVVYPSTASNYFHVLRRSFTWPFRRPMIVLTPKRTLRVEQATSELSDFLRNEKSVFSPVLDDDFRSLEAAAVESIVVCSGEVFYDIQILLQDIPEKETRKVAVIRLEQLAPFPFHALTEAVACYSNARRAVWVQEEPANMGALRFAAPFLARSLSSMELSKPISRPVSAAPAVGNPRDHQASQSELMSLISSWITCSNR